LAKEWLDISNVHVLFCIVLITEIVWYKKYIGNTLLEGVCIRLTWQLHNHDMIYVIMNMKKVYACLW